MISILNKFPIGNSVFVKNVLGLLVSKGLQIVISFVQVPLLLKLLKVEEYGVWITILSIVTWAQILNFGLGNGLRNYAAQAFADSNIRRLQKLVSTSFYTLLLIALLLSLIFVPLIIYLPWDQILNTKINLTSLKIVIAVVIGSFLFRFVADVIVILLKADRKEAKADLIIPFSNLIYLLFLLFFVYTSFEISFTSLSYYYLFSQIVVISVISIVLFNGIYKSYKPNFLDFDKSMLGDLFSMGIKFFIIQVTGIILFSSSNMILINLMGSESVVEFNIVRQLFMVPLMLFGILAAPLWTMTSQALHKGEHDKLNKLFLKINKIGLLGGFALLIIFFFRDFIIQKWTNGVVNTSFELALMFVIYNFASILLSPYSQFVNGAGKLTLGLYVAIFKAIIFLPITIWFTRTYGSVGFISSQFLVNILPNLVFELRQYYLIVNKKAYGIWDK